MSTYLVTGAGGFIASMVCWFSESPLQPATRYLIRNTTWEARCVIKVVRYQVDINTLHRKEVDLAIALNGIGRLHLRTSIPLLFDSYKRNRSTGCFILVDKLTNVPVAAA